MIKIRLKNCLSFTTGGKNYVKGEVYDVSEKDAKVLLSSGLFIVSAKEEVASKEAPQGVISMSDDGKQVITKDISEIKCPYCDRVFKTEKALKIHIGRSHKDVKKKG